MGDSYQLCCLFSQFFARSELRTSSSRGISGDTLKQSLAKANNQFIDLLEASQPKFHKNGKVFPWTCVEVLFYFQVRSYSYTDWTSGCSFSPITMLLLWDSYFFCLSLNKWVKFVGQYLRITEDGSNHSRN